MSFAAILRHGSLGFSEWSALTLGFLCLGLISFNSRCHNSVSFIFSFFMSILLSFFYQFFIQTSLFLCDSVQPVSQPEFAIPPELSLATLFILTWALLIAKAKDRRGDPVICYAYWPQSPLWRLPALISYYASSNGLFVLILCCISFLLFDTVLSIEHFESLDLITVLIYFVGSYALLLQLCQRPFFPKNPSIGLGFLGCLWVSHFLFMYYSPRIPWSFGNFGEYKRTIFFLMSGVSIPLDSATFTLSFSLTVLWGVFWGSALSRYIYWDLRIVAGVAFGQFLGFHGTLYLLQKEPTLCLIVFFALLGLNGLRAQTPIHMIDCPWRTSQRLPLRPIRWLIAMGMSPWIFAMLYTLSGKPSIFFMLHNFSLLIVLGLIYPFIWEIGERLQPIFSWYGRKNLYIKALPLPDLWQRCNSPRP